MTLGLFMLKLGQLNIKEDRLMSKKIDLSKIEESPDKFYDKEYYFGGKKSNYADYYNLTDNPIFWSIVINTIKKYNIRGSHLDIGCALGTLLKHIKKCCPGITSFSGIDISHFAIEEAKKQAPFADLLLGNINKGLPYPNKSFDLITELEILEHTPSIEVTLKEAVSKLKDNGYLIVSLPLKDAWVYRLLEPFEKDASHGNVVTKKELEDIMDRVGLKILERHSYWYAPFLGMYIKGIPWSVWYILQKK